MLSEMLPAVCMALGRILTLGHKLVTEITSLTVLPSWGTIQASQYSSRSPLRNILRPEATRVQMQHTPYGAIVLQADTGVGAYL